MTPQTRILRDAGHRGGAWTRWIRRAFLRVGGDSLDGPILKDQVLYGDLLTVLRELDAQVDAQLTQFPVPDTMLRERSVESYLRVAVRELLMNAIMHRDYASTAPLRITWLDDHLEIQNPGGLYGEASPTGETDAPLVSDWTTKPWRAFADS
jgi:ATP-dependent DNA helicase RecG